MQFKQLSNGSKFEFDHTNLEPHLRRGLWSENNKPFIKISARKYIVDSNPFSLDEDERNFHQQNIGLEYQVGSINVDVICLD